jgi:hypothetical protein
MKVVDKAFAYVTNGERLLVFEHADFLRLACSCLPGRSWRVRSRPAL